MHLYFEIKDLSYYGELESDIIYRKNHTDFLNECLISQISVYNLLHVCPIHVTAPG